jgi:hypothetical protein
LTDVELTLEKRKKILRFHPSTDVTKTTDRKQPTEPALSSLSIDNVITNRIAKLEDFLLEKQNRIRAARKSTLTMAAAKEAECELHNAIQRSKIARSTKNGDVKRESSLPLSEKDHSRSFHVCSECQKALRAKDKFWGLASESADEEEYQKQVLTKGLMSTEVTELNEDEADELFEKLEIKEEQHNYSSKKRSVDFRVSSPFKITDPVSPGKAYIIKQRPSGQAGHGTWVTPPYSPHWTVTSTHTKVAPAASSRGKGMEL